MSHKATICIGSNTPDSARRLFDAVEFILTQARVLATSGQYRSEAEFQGNHPGVPLYMNEVMKLEVEAEYDDFQRKLKAYEGDVRAESSMRYPGLVGIDIDIVVWENQIMRPRDFSSRYFRLGISSLSNDKA